MSLQCTIHEYIHLQLYMLGCNKPHQIDTATAHSSLDGTCFEIIFLITEVNYIHCEFKFDIKNTPSILVCSFAMLSMQYLFQSI